jgi:hypothetical protein
VVRGSRGGLNLTGALLVSVLLNCLYPFPGCSTRLHPDRDNLLRDFNWRVAKVGENAARFNADLGFRDPDGHSMETFDQVRLDCAIRL